MRRSSSREIAVFWVVVPKQTRNSKQFASLREKQQLHFAFMTTQIKYTCTQSITSITKSKFSLISYLYTPYYWRLVYRLRDWGFIPGRVTLKTLKIVFAAFAPGAGHSGSAKGFVYALFFMYDP